MGYRQRHRKDNTHHPVVDALTAEGCTIGDVASVDRFFDLIVAVPVVVSEGRGRIVTTSVVVMVELKRHDWRPKSDREAKRDADQRALAMTWTMAGVCCVRTDNADDVIAAAQRWHAALMLSVS